MAGAYLSRVSRCGLGNTVVSESWFGAGEMRATEGQPFSRHPKEIAFAGVFSAQASGEPTRLIAKSGLKDKRRSTEKRFLKAYV